MNSHQDPLTPRRQFLKSSSAAFLGSALVSPLGFPNISSGAPTSDKLKIGFIGCGGRGTGAAAQALKADSNVELHAMGDVFADRIEQSLESLQKEAPDKINVTPERRFVGLDAYQKVIASGVDVVLLTTPPGFRPLHIKAAVEAGKHIFTEKPMAVDGPGVRSVLASLAEARKKKLAVVDGFVWRYSQGHRATYKKIQDGALGGITSLYSCYNAGQTTKHDKWNRENCQTDLEWTLRRWYFFTWLSGDHIVEQAVHSIDKMLWAMNDEPPLKAIAHGGRQVRTGAEEGHIFDHFAVVYEWANGVKGFHFCRQQNYCAAGTTDTIFGTKGVCDIVSSRRLMVIKGANPWRYEGRPDEPYQTEHDEMYASIRAGALLHTGDRMINSTLMAILGRMAAYTGQEITWEQALNSTEVLMPPDLDWNMRLPVPAVALPGKTKFV